MGHQAPPHPANLLISKTWASLGSMGKQSGRLPGRLAGKSGGGVGEEGCWTAAGVGTLLMQASLLNRVQSTHTLLKSVLLIEWNWVVY